MRPSVTTKLGLNYITPVAQASRPALHPDEPEALLARAAALAAACNTRLRRPRESYWSSKFSQHRLAFGPGVRLSVRSYGQPATSLRPDFRLCASADGQPDVPASRQ